MKDEVTNQPEPTFKTRAEEIRAKFKRDGISIAAWAAANNLSTPLIYEILRGARQCVRGESHRAAVLLGLKDGDPGANAKTYDPRRAA